MQEKLNNQKQIILKISILLVLGISLSVIWLINGYYNAMFRFTSFIPFLLLIISGLYMSLPKKVLFPVIYLLEMLHCISIIVIGVKGGDFDEIAQALVFLNFLFINLLTTIFFICILVQHRKQISSKKKLILGLLLVITVAFALCIIYYKIVFSGIFPKYGSILPFLNDHL